MRDERHTATGTRLGLEHGLSAEPVRREARQTSPLVIAVVGGRDGVGKTSLAVNLAVAMAELGERVLLLDGDWGLSGVDGLLGLDARHTLHDVLRGRKRVDEIVLAGPARVRVVPGASGVPEMADLDDIRREMLLRQALDWPHHAGVVLIDTGPGVHRLNLRLAQRADEILAVATPEPAAGDGAFATLRALAGCRLARAPRLIVNRSPHAADARRVARRLRRLSERELDRPLELLGIVPADEVVRRAAVARLPFVQLDPGAPASRSVRALALRLLETSPAPAVSGRRAPSGVVRDAEWRAALAA